LSVTVFGVKSLNAVTVNYFRGNDRRMIDRQQFPADKARETHAGLVLAEHLAKREMSVADAASQIGTARQLLHEIIAGRKPMSIAMARRIEAAIGASAYAMARAQFERAMIDDS
jgi:plasmid maintenance system antidote protein VapI